MRAPAPSSLIGACAAAGGWAGLAGASFSPAGFSPQSKSSKLVLPSLCLTRSARSPSSWIWSTTTCLDSSGINASETRMSSSAAKSFSLLNSDNRVLPRCTPSFGNNMRRISPSMVSVRWVFSLTRSITCVLYWFGSKVAAMNASAAAKSSTTAPTAIRTHFSNFMDIASRLILRRHYRARTRATPLSIAVHGRRIQACAQQIGRLFHRQRPAEQEALDLVAFVFAQEAQLLGGFHAFCNHAQIHAVAELDHGARNGRIVRVGADVAHEGLVYFQPVHREALQIAQARIPGAEIVDAQAHAEFLQRVQCLDELLCILHHQALGELELQALRRQSSIGQCPRHGFHQIAPFELARGDIDRQHHRR